MGLFDDTLKDSESLFKNEIALDPSFRPKKISYRENENQEIANCIKPLLDKRNGKNLLIHGEPGIGKTLACKKVLEELEETTDDIIPIYINCWKKDTSYKAVVEICSIIGYKLIQNKKTDELLDIITQRLNKRSVVFVLDEIDKLTDYSFLYSILEDIYRKSIVMITNDKHTLHKFEPRLKSRLIPELLEFRPYKLSEIHDILKQRVEYAFYAGIMDNDAFEKIVEKTFELKDIRVGLFLLKESGNFAEEKASKKIIAEHALKAIDKLKEYNKPMELDEDESSILELIKLNPEKTTPELFEIYQKQGGDKTDRTFHRKLKNLEKAKLISISEIEDAQGKSFKIRPAEVEKKISDF